MWSRKKHSWKYSEQREDKSYNLILALLEFITMANRATQQNVEEKIANNKMQNPINHYKNTFTQKQIWMPTKQGTQKPVKTLLLPDLLQFGVVLLFSVLFFYDVLTFGIL